MDQFVLQRYHSCANNEPNMVNRSKKADRTHKRRVEPPIKQPTSADLREVAENLRLRANGASLLTQFVTDLAAEIKRAVSRGDHDLRNLRRRRLQFLQNFSGQLDALTTLLDENEAPILRHILAPELGRFLSTDAFELIVKYELGQEISLRTLEMVKRNRPRSGPYRELEHEVVAERQTLASRGGEHFLAGVLRRLRPPLRNILGVETLSTGGAPPLPVRRHILTRLVELHNRLSRLYGDAWPRQHYVDLAEQVLPALGQPTDGLEKAVERFVGKL